MKSSIFLILTICLISCAPKKQITNFQGYFSNGINKELISNNWFLKDIQKDSVPGISLERAYKDFSTKDSLSPVVIAVIDTEIDINHEDLQGAFWTNNKEIANNDKDDDNNGYTDDIHGWNFLGNKKGNNVINTLYEYVRIVRDSIRYKNLDTDSFKFIQYQRALSFYNSYYSRIEKIINEAPPELKRYKKELEFLQKYTVDSIDQQKLNSIIKSNPKIKDSVQISKKWLSRDVSYIDLLNNFRGIERKFNYYLNITYNDRFIINDAPYDINDRDYGNSSVNNNLDELYHGTVVAGVLASKMDNGKGSNFFEDHLKIMPVCISANGDENDKDMALAIRYATDNGAKIINISSGKYYSGNYEWVQESIQYASSKDVLIVVGAGNDNQNLDNDDVYFFPNDINPETGLEITNAFIRVGASSYDNQLKWNSSNYGTTEVDIFAPGDNIRVPLPFNKYDNIAGTSIASPFVAGVAFLIRSTYPSLTAPEVKKILMDSSVKYDVLVDVPTKENPEQQLPFSDLSKSGGIVNAYNAMLMAEEYVKSKK